MRMRSTGLGKTELVAYVEGMSRQGDYLLLSTRTTEPVRWHVRVALDYKDMMKMVKCFFKPSVITFFIPIGSRVKNPKEPGEY